jgi:hypothetical protein
MGSLCVLGAECEWYERGPSPSHGFNLCDGCTTHCRADVSALVYDYVDLSQVIARRDGHSEAKISRPKPSSTPPIDLAVDTLRSDITGALLTAELVVRQALALSARPNLHVRDGFNVQQAAGLVAAHVDALAGLAVPPWAAAADNMDLTGADLLMRLRSLHSRARRTAGLADLTVALPGYCPKCQAQALSRRDGCDTVHCGSCRFAWPWAEYQRHVTLVVTQIDPRKD